MANPDSRCLPLVEVELDQIQALLSPVLRGAAIAGVERVEGGLTNTLYRITPADGGVSLCLRIFAAGRLPWDRELKILARVSASFLFLPRFWQIVVRLTSMVYSQMTSFA